MQRGMYGELQSITPRSRAGWALRDDRKTPGQLGIYGSATARTKTYEGLSIAPLGLGSRSRRCGQAGEKGLRSMLIGVPPSFHRRRVPRLRVGCFLTRPRERLGVPAGDGDRDPRGLARETTTSSTSRTSGAPATTSRSNQVFKMTERGSRWAGACHEQAWTSSCCARSPRTASTTSSAALGPHAPALRAWNKYETRSRTTTGSSTARSARCWRSCPMTPSRS